MAAFAVGEVAVSESAFIVVASHTTHRPTRRKMFGGNRRADLLCLRRAGFDRMAIGATEPLSRPVIGVSEIRLKRYSIGRSPAVTAQ